MEIYCTALAIDARTNELCVTLFCAYVKRIKTGVGQDFKWIRFKLQSVFPHKAFRRLGIMHTKHMDFVYTFMCFLELEFQLPSYQPSASWMKKSYMFGETWESRFLFWGSYGQKILIWQPLPCKRYTFESSI